MADSRTKMVRRVADRYGSKAAAPMSRTAGEVRFIKDRGGDEKNWAYSDAPPSQRDMNVQFEFNTSKLKPLARCLRSALMALGHTQSAYHEFTKIKSASISPDGNLGGKGYIQEIKSMRRQFMNCSEALSALTDTLYDEINAPHWSMDNPTVDRQREDVKEIMDDVEEIRDNPEAAAEESEEGQFGKQARRKTAGVATYGKVEEFTLSNGERAQAKFLSGGYWDLYVGGALINKYEPYDVKEHGYPDRETVEYLYDIHQRLREKHRQHVRARTSKTGSASWNRIFESFDQDQREVIEQAEMEVGRLDDALAQALQRLRQVKLQTVFNEETKLKVAKAFKDYCDAAFQDLSSWGFRFNGKWDLAAGDLYAGFVYGSREHDLEVKLGVFGRDSDSRSIIQMLFARSGQVVQADVPRNAETLTSNQLAVQIDNSLKPLVGTKEAGATIENLRRRLSPSRVADRANGSTK